MAAGIAVVTAAATSKAFVLGQYNRIHMMAKLSPLPSIFFRQARHYRPLPRTGETEISWKR